MENNIFFSKIVATPTLNSWSQAYNAGKFFAVLSLEKTQTQTQDFESLNILGRDLLERLEQEFFTIEDKNLESIKTAISNTFQNPMEGVSFSFAAGAFIGNVLYLFALGQGKVYVKRDGGFGSVLDSTSTNPQDIISSSGFLKDDDLIVLCTHAFSEIISNDNLNANLNGLPSDIAESLAPKAHKAENGKISAIIIKYENPLAQEVIDEGVEVDEPEEITQEEEKIEKTVSPFGKYLSMLKSKLRRPNLKIQPTRKVFLALTIIIVFVLASSIFFAVQQQNNAKVRAVFAEIYPQAEKKYDEGQSLSDLNKNLARDSYMLAQKILNDSKDKFPPKSKEATQTQDLLKKVESGLSQFSPVDKSGLDRSKLSVAVQNGSGIEGTAGKAADILKELGYNTSTGNADNYNYKGVTIKVKKSKSDFLDLLKKDLSKNYTISSTSSDLSPDFSTDALIIIGK